MWLRWSIIMRIVVSAARASVPDRGTKSLHCKSRSGSQDGCGRGSGIQRSVGEQLSVKNRMQKAVIARPVDGLINVMKEPPIPVRVR